MADTPPDLLRIEVEREDEVRADKADLHVTVEGGSLVTGGAITRRAREVNQLVEALAGCGIAEEHVFIEGASAQVEAGLLTKSSTAQYRLRIRVPDLGKLGEAMEVVGGRKNVAMNHMAWRYEGLDATLQGWLTGLLQQANAKAELVASGLGVRILGVHGFHEQRWDPDRPPPTIAVRHSYEDSAADLSAPRMGRARAGGGSGLAFEVAHSKRVRLVVVVDYRVGPRGAPA